MYCRDCPRYDAKTERCADRKVNPMSWESAVQVSQVMGLRSICTFNDFRERLVASRKPMDTHHPPIGRSR